MGKMTLPQCRGFQLENIMIANTAAKIETINTPEELIPWLFEELLAGLPRQPVQPSLILAAGGACYGIIFGGLSGTYCNLLEIFSEYWLDDEPTDCGVPFIKFTGLRRLTQTMGPTLTA
jgi:hypothetical protein